MEANFSATKDVVLTFSRRRLTLSRGAKCKGWFGETISHFSWLCTWKSVDSGAPICSRSVRACGGSKRGRGRPTGQWYGCGCHGNIAHRYNIIICHPSKTQMYPLYEYHTYTNTSSHVHLNYIVYVHLSCAKAIVLLGMHFVVVLAPSGLGWPGKENQGNVKHITWNDRPLFIHNYFHTKTV